MRRVAKSGDRDLAYDRRHALVVGVNRYSPPFGSLKAPNNDASEVAGVLADRFGFESVSLLLDAEPAAPVPSGVTVSRVPLIDRATLRARLAALKETVGPRDALFVFYAGHGLRLGARGYAVPGDGDPGRPESLLDLADLAAALRACDAHHTLLVLDCCYSGAVLEPAGGAEAAVGALADRGLGARDLDNLARVFNRRSFQVVTAGTGQEEVEDVVSGAQKYAELAALPEFRGHSPFTAVLLSALRGQTGRPDGKLLASDLGYFMNATLVNDARIGARQAPRYGALGQGTGEFVFLPARKVLNPRLVAPLYLGGAEYAELRRSAVAALAQFLAAQPAADRLPLARSAVPHLARLLQDAAPGPRAAASAALADLATAYEPSAVPELQPATAEFARLVADPKQPDDIRRAAARGLGRLRPWADEPAVAALRAYTAFREAEWQGHTTAVATKLKIPPGQFRLPDRLAAEVAALAVPPAPAKGAPWADHLGYEDARRARQEKLSPFGLEPYLLRHEQGIAWLERAQKLLGEKDVVRAKLTLAAALGFSEFGPAPAAEFRRNNPALLFPNTPAWHRAAELLRRSPHAYPGWATPGPHGEQVLALTVDGRRAATVAEDKSIRIWDALAGVPIARLAPRPLDPNTPEYLTAVNGPAAFSPAGDRFALWDRDQTLAVWSVPDGAEVVRLTFAGEARVEALAFSPDGGALATAETLSFKPAPTRVWELPSGKERARFAVAREVTALAFSPDGQRLAAADNVNLLARADLHVWPIGGGEGIKQALPLNTVRHMAFVPGRGLVLAGKHPGAADTDPGVLFWDVATGKATGALKGHDPFNAGLGPTIDVLAFAFSADGKRAASVGNDSTLRIWDADAGTVAHAIHRFGGPAAVAFSPDGGTVIASGGRQTLRRWDARTGRELGPDPGHVGTAFGVACSPDGRWVASAGVDATVRIWDAASGKPVAVLRGHPKMAVAVAWAPDGSCLASAGQEGTVRLWAVPAAKPEGAGAMFAERRVLTGPTKTLRALAFAPDGKTVAAAGDDSVIRFWSVESGQLVGKLEGHEASVYSIAFSPNGKTLVSAALKFGPANPMGDPSVRFWSVPDMAPQDKGVLRRAQSAIAFAPDGSFVTVGQNEVSWWAETKKSVRKTATAENFPKAATFSPDGKLLATAAGGTIQLWDAATGAEVVRLTGHNEGAVRGTVNGLAFAPDGRALFSAGEDGVVRRWDFAPDRALATLAHALPAVEPDQPRPQRGPVTGLAWAEPGRVLAAAGKDGAVRLWEVETGKELPGGEMAVPPGGEKAWAHALAVSPDGKLVAKASDDGVVRLWDAKTGAARGECTGLKGNATCVAFSADGKTVAAGDTNGAVLCWEVATRKQLSEIRVRAFGAVTGVAFAPDGTTLAVSAEANAAFLFDWRAAKELTTIKTPNGALPSTFVRYSPDGKTLAIGWMAGDVTLWDVEKGRPRAVADCDRDTQRASARFTPNGTELVVAAKSGVVVLDVATGKEIIALTDLPFAARSLEVTPDGSRLAVGLEDGTVRLWEMPRAPDLSRLRPYADFGDNQLRWRLPPAPDRLYPPKSDG